MGNQSRIEIILAAVDRGLTTGFNRALASLKSFVAGAKEADTGVKGLTSSVSGLLGPLLATVSAAAGMQKLVSVSREFDKLSAGLITATGSIEGSEQAFAAVQDFATRTPYDLAQVTDSFVKLVNFGLDPSERALTSYGNTSSALGKNLNQMIEAVADAATGEFERLKEFGIKASSEGDKVSFTFRGVTTTVGKNAAEIEQYLIKLGETNFGDAMANRMQTLDGALSNLGDEWNKVFLNISQAGIGDMIASGVRAGIDALEELNAMIKSGELEGYIRAIGISFSGWGDDAKAAVAVVLDEMRGMEVGGKDSVTFLIDAFRQFPENVRAFIGLVTVYVAAEFDKVKARAVAFKATIAAMFTPGDTYDVGQVASDLDRELKIANNARDAAVDSILAERDATLQASAARRTQAQLDRVAFEEKEKARKAASADTLAQFKVQSAGQQQATKATKADTQAKSAAATAARQAATEAKKEYEEQKKVAAEKLRFVSQDKILAMELEKIEAGTLGSKLERAEAELAIDKRIMAERISLKRQELAAMQADAAKSDSNTSQADVIRAEGELAALQVDAVSQEHANLKEVASANLAQVEAAWRRGQVSVEEYQAAVQYALSRGVVDKEIADRDMIMSGDNMTAALKLGFTDWAATVKTDAEFVADMFGQVANSIGSGISEAFNSMIDGSKSAKDAMLDFARSTISMVAQMIAQQMIYNAIKSAGMAFGLSTGGAVAALAAGGPVPGWSPSKTADNIPALLTAGEFVHPVDAVSYYGAHFMELLRRRAIPRNLAHALAGGTLPRIPSGNRLAAGGMAAGPSQTTLKAGDTRLRVINVLDKNMVGDYMKTADGETAIINLIRRNGSAIRTILG